VAISTRNDQARQTRVQVKKRPNLAFSLKKAAVRISVPRFTVGDFDGETGHGFVILWGETRVLDMVLLYVSG
jgi:hypothetical protein